jgi:rubrerythrin
MAVGEEFLRKAIHSEIIARNAYEAIAAKIEATEGKQVMLDMSAEEDNHRSLLSTRYQALSGKEFVFDPNLKPGPDFSFVEKSVFGHTDAVEALSLCLGAEIDAIAYYSGELVEATETEDVKMLKFLVKFETKHKKKLEKELKRLQDTNHWNM